MSEIGVQKIARRPGQSINLSDPGQGRAQASEGIDLGLGKAAFLGCCIAGRMDFAIDEIQRMDPVIGTASARKSSKIG